MNMFKLGIISSAFIGVTLFAGNQNYAGCGLGSQVFEKNDKVSQILASTTNSTSANQAFGITSGTSGCNKNGTMSQKEELNIFTGRNLQKLAFEISVGNGETLNTFASLKGISINDRASFNKKLQNNFEKIFTKESITAGEVLSNINTII